MKQHISTMHLVVEGMDKNLDTVKMKLRYATPQAAEDLDLNQLATELKGEFPMLGNLKIVWARGQQGDATECYRCNKGCTVGLRGGTCKKCGGFGWLHVGDTW